MNTTRSPDYTMQIFYIDIPNNNSEDTNRELETNCTNNDLEPKAEVVRTSPSTGEKNEIQPFNDQT